MLKKESNISTVIEITFVKNLLKTLGLSIPSYRPTSATYNFVKEHEDTLSELLGMIDDDTKIVQTQNLLNEQGKKFWLFLLTIPLDFVQVDFYQYFLGRKDFSLHMLVFFRDSFRQIFTEHKVGRDGYYQLLSDNAKLILVDLSHTIELKEFNRKLRERVFVNEDTLQYFWTRVFMVEYGRYI